MNKIVILTISILLSASLVHSQQESKIYPMSEVVITASKQVESRGNVTQKIDVLSDSTISTIVLSSNNLSEAVGLKPGSSVRPLSRNDANWGTYGGIGPKYSTYMLQGLPIDAFVDPMALDISSIARIEVQRGPASVLYPNYLSQDFAGNQSPLTGTVNLILRDRINAPRTVASASYGSYNTLSSRFLHEDNSKSVNYFVGAAYEKSDYTNYGTDNSWLNMKKDPEYAKTKLFGGASMEVDDGQKFSLFVNRTFHTGDAGRVYRGYDNDYSLLNAGYSLSLSENVLLQSRFGFRQYDRSWQESNFDAIDTLQSNNGVMQKIVPVDISFSIKHGRDNLLVAGADYQHAGYSTWSDPLLGFRQYGNKSSGTQAGIYGQEEYRVDRLTLRAGVRYSYTENDIVLIDGGAPGENSRHWSSFLWSGGIRYRMSDKIAVYGNGGNSFIAPGLKSTGGTIKLSDKGIAGRNGQLPNPDLKPESGIGFDLGTDIYLLSGMSFGFRAFLITVNDAIIENVVSQDPSQSQSINAGKSHSTGFEVEASQHLNSTIAWFANYTYTKTRIDNPSNQDQDGTEIPFAPDHNANVGLNLTFDFGLQVHPALNYSSKFYDSNSKSSRSAFTPGTVVNLSAMQILSRGDRYTTEIFVLISNLTDNRYEMPWQFRNTGRSVTGGLKVTF